MLLDTERIREEIERRALSIRRGIVTEREGGGRKKESDRD